VHGIGLAQGTRRSFGGFTSFSHFSHFSHFTSQSFSAVHVALWPEALILCACTLYVVPKKGAKYKEPILIIVPWYHSCILVLCGCSPIFVSLWAYWTLPSWSRSSIRWWPRCLPLSFATWRRHQGLECQHVRSNHFWYSFMPLQSHLSKLASWEDCSSIFLFLLFFFCRDDSIWYSLILSYVWWDMIKLTCKSQWSPYRSCRIGFSYLWDDPWQNPTGEGAIRVRQVGISVLLKSSQICSLQCCSSTGHVTYGHHIWSVHTAWYSYVHIVLYYIMVYIWYSTFVYIASHVLELPADQLFIRAPGGFTQHRGTGWPERPRRNIVTFLCQIWQL
jgi:hypothetical protein